MSYAVIVSLIAATTSMAGLRVYAELDATRYPTGMTVTDAELATMQLARDLFHGDWNYSIHPHPMLH